MNFITLLECRLPKMKYSVASSLLLSLFVLLSLLMHIYSRPQGSIPTSTAEHPLSFSQLIFGAKLNEGSMSISSMLQNVESESHLLLKGTHRMDYGIFKGESSLRTLPESITELPQLSADNKVLHVLLLLLQQRLDQAHEIVLGVTIDNLEKAEYAATHPGETSWSADHPLSTVDDILHCIIHRFEGENTSVEGGGRATGYDNAKYWLAGGDKQLEFMENHDLWLFLRDYVTMNHNRFGCLNLVALDVNEDCTSRERKYLIIASGGKKRYVNVNPKMWDEFRFIDLCALRYASATGQDLLHKFEEELNIVWDKEWSCLIDELQLVQLQFLFRLAMEKALSSG